MSYELVTNGDGTVDLLDPDGNTIASGIATLVSTTDDVVLDAILDDVGVINSTLRAAIKAMVQGVEVREP